MSLSSTKIVSTSTRDFTVTTIATIDSTDLSGTGSTSTPTAEITATLTGYYNADTTMTNYAIPSLSEIDDLSFTIGQIDLGNQFQNLGFIEKKRNQQHQPHQATTAVLENSSTMITTTEIASTTTDGFTATTAETATIDSTDLSVTENSSTTIPDFSATTADFRTTYAEFDSADTKTIDSRVTETTKRHWNTTEQSKIFNDVSNTLSYQSSTGMIRKINE